MKIKVFLYLSIITYFLAILPIAIMYISDEAVYGMLLMATLPIGILLGTIFLLIWLINKDKDKGKDIDEDKDKDKSGLIGIIAAIVSFWHFFPYIDYFTWLLAVFFSSKGLSHAVKNKSDKTLSILGLVICFLWLVGELFSAFQMNPEPLMMK